MAGSRKRGRPAVGPDAPSWLIARFLRVTVARLLLLLFRVRCTGSAKVPEGGAVLAGNHVSYLDPVLLWCCSPRPTHFMAKAELWDTWPLGWVLENLWAFPVVRTGSDREAITTATHLLEGRELVGVFPEGTRKRDDSDELGEAYGGAAFLALRTGVPVVPVGIVGTEKAWPPGKRLPRIVPVTLRYGEPVRPEDFEGTRKEKVAAMTVEVMRRIDEERQRGREG